MSGRTSRWSIAVAGPFVALVLGGCAATPPPPAFAGPVVADPEPRCRTRADCPNGLVCRNSVVNVCDVCEDDSQCSPGVCISATGTCYDGDLRQRCNIDEQCSGGGRWCERILRYPGPWIPRLGRAAPCLNQVDYAPGQIAPTEEQREKFLRALLCIRSLDKPVVLVARAAAPQGDAWSVLLAQARVEWLREQMIAAGVAPDIIMATPIGALEADPELERVEFRWPPGFGSWQPQLDESCE